MYRFAIFAVTLCVSFTALADDAAERAAYIRANYTKFEYRVPMRDGVKLFTSVYMPNVRSAKMPLLLARTPYSCRPYGADKYAKRLGPYAEFEKEGFIFVYQDVRGRFMSEGKFVNMRPHIDNKRTRTQIDESTDTYDTIRWLLKNVPGHNGKVGMRGISYLGFYSAAGAIDSHPALKAVSPQAPIADWYWDDMHHHGAFILPLNFRFFHIFGQEQKPAATMTWPERFDFPTQDMYAFYKDLGPLSNVEKLHFKGKIKFWTAMMEHPNYDEFWQSRNIVPHLKNIRAAMLTVGGWYDAEDLYGPLAIYKSIEKLNPKADNKLVMGPWSHGGWVRGDGATLGDASFGFPTSTYYQKHIELDFFKHHLKGAKRPPLPEALVFETGANRWREFDAWPPKAAKPRAIHLRAGGRLSWDTPGTADGADSFVSDPERPVPYTMSDGIRMNKGYPTEDQRFASRRPDVLVYETEVLKDDLTIAGELRAELFVSTSQSSADWIVKVIDVQPGRPLETDNKRVREGVSGQHMLVRGEVFRGRFRDSYEHPKPFVPGEVAKISFPLWDVLHTFKRGHKLMIHVQSTWFPLVDRNPQKYVPNIFKAKASDFVKATHTVHRSKAHASKVTFGVLP